MATQPSDNEVEMYRIWMQGNWHNVICILVLMSLGAIMHVFDIPCGGIAFGFGVLFALFGWPGNVEKEEE